MRARENRSILRVLILAVLALTLVSSFSSIGGATDKRTLQSRKHSIQRKMAALRAKIAKLKHEGKDVSAQIYRLDRELEDTQHDLDRTVLDLNRNRVQQASLKKRLNDTIARFVAKRNQYKDRLVMYYRNGGSGYIEVLFNSTNFGDFISRMYYIRRIAMNDISVMDELRDLRAEVETRKAQVEEKGRQIESLKVSIQQKKAYAEGVKSEKTRYLKKIEGDVQLSQEALNELEAESNRIEDELRRIPTETGPQFTGSAGSPLCGAAIRVSSGFGYRHRPRAGASENHRGVDLSAKYGQSVCAVADGVVFSAGWRRGYGRTVILLHGDIATVYAHGLSILVSQGQRVQRGQIIMRADTSGISTGNHLHFEVRKNGIPVNPLGYLR